MDEMEYQALKEKKETKEKLDVYMECNLAGYCTLKILKAYIIQESRKNTNLNVSYYVLCRIGSH